jgi:cytochrome c biogenesis protein CcmG/thiol:disulfide interchange protein DsbE
LLNSYYLRQQKAGLRVVAVTTEDSLPIYKLRPLAADLAVPMVPSFRGNDGGPPNFLPTNFIIDRDGILRYAKVGELTLDALNDLLVPLLQAGRAVEPAI